MGGLQVMSLKHAAVLWDRRLPVRFHPGAVISERGIKLGADAGSDQQGMLVEGECWKETPNIHNLL